MSRFNNMVVAMWNPGFSWCGDKQVTREWSKETFPEKTAIFIEKFKETYAIIQKKGLIKEDTLVLYVTPEDTFSNLQNIQEGCCYAPSDVHEFNRVFSSLSQEYPNSLLVTGTLTVKKALKEGRLDYSANKKVANSFFNGNVHKYTKRTVAYNDLPVSTIYPQSRFFAGNKSSIFSVNNLKMGVEICLDHTKGTLRNESQPLDVHIILSNTINLNPANIANSKRTVVIHCSTAWDDGYKEATRAGVWIKSGQGHIEKVGIDYSDIHFDGIGLTVNTRIYEPIIITQEMHLDHNEEFMYNSLKK